MERTTAVLVLWAIAAGRKSTNPKALMPGPYPTEEQEYLEGFADGYRGARSLDPHPRDSAASSRTSFYSQGVRDGYLTGRKDEMQRK